MPGLQRFEIKYRILENFNQTLYSIGGVKRVLGSWALIGSSVLIGSWVFSVSWVPFF